MNDVLFKAFVPKDFASVKFTCGSLYLQGDPDPLQASDPWGGCFVVLPAIEFVEILGCVPVTGPAIQNGKIADHEENNRSTEKAGQN